MGLPARGKIKGLGSVDYGFKWHQSRTIVYDGAWSKFEEMVDWIAIQGPKIYWAWEAAGALCRLGDDMG